MIRFVYADDMKYHANLVQSMFSHRTEQFKKRLDWDVNVDRNGWERDQYDVLNPLYIIWENVDGYHGGSLRLLPTIGRTMTAEHFLHLTDGVRIESPLIWECTRFCSAPGASPVIAGALLAAGVELGLRFGLDQAIGVVYSRTLGVYHRIGHAPDVIGSDGIGRDSISICIWNLTEAARDRICARCGIPAARIAEWFDASFQATAPERAAA